MTRKTPQLLAEFGPAYIALGIPVIPVNGKRPAIKKWQERTIHNFHWIAKQFPDANIGILTGRRSGLTVVDVDDLDQVDTAISLFGDTCIKVQTPNGMHMYYRSRGERRSLRYAGMPIDILGEKSYCVAPPSESEKGKYRFVEGSLDRIDELPFMKRQLRCERKVDSADACRHHPTASKTVMPLSFEVGSRNNDLFSFACKTACEHDDRGTIEALVRQENHEIATPLNDEEVTNIIDSIYKYKSEGTLRMPGGEQWISLAKSEVENLTPEALQLLAHLKLCYDVKNGKEFFLANATKNRLGISLSKLRRNRDRG